MRPSLNYANKYHTRNEMQDAFYTVLEAFNVLPHKASFSEAEFPPTLIYERYKLEVQCNALLADIYAYNAKQEAFSMKNAKNDPHAMEILAIQSLNVVIDICNNDKYQHKTELQLIYLQIIPQFLLLSNKLQRISQIETNAMVLKMLNISQQLYDTASLERAKILNEIIDLMAIYCPDNQRLLQNLSTDILYNCSRPMIKKNNAPHECALATQWTINARTKLLQLWFNQDWTATLRICRKIAFKEVSTVMKKDLAFFCKLRLDELPLKELYQKLLYFQIKFKNPQDIFYGNTIIVEKLIKTKMFSKAAKILISKIQAMEEDMVDHQNIHYQCLQLLLVTSQEQYTNNEKQSADE